ncbi:CBS domain-containing protein [Candidatus Altiarchaeota archaeon]
MILDKKVAEIMQSKVVTVGSSTKVFDIACIMGRKNIGSVVITDDDSVKGIITERDITKQLLNGNDIANIPASRLMVSDIISASPETTVREAINTLFAHKFRRLPIIKNGRLVGIITSTDICYEINNPHACTNVGEIMRTNVSTIDSQKTIREALTLMFNAKSTTGRMGVGNVVITEDKMVKGILTERDIIKYVVCKKKDIDETLVGDVMSTGIITIRPDVIVCHAADLLIQYHFRHLPVINEQEELIGMVSQTLLIAEIKKNYESGTACLR